MQLNNCSQIFTLGPEGTFSDEAAQKIRGDGVIVTYTGTFAEALSRVTKNSDSVAVVPIENSVAGTVAQVQDSLVSNELVILGEINLLIEYSLLANVALEDVKLCFAHPQALEQSSKFLSKNLTEPQNQLTRSNVDSGIQFLQAIKSDNGALAAIVPASFADSYPKWKVATGIQDYHNIQPVFWLYGPVRKMKNMIFHVKKHPFL